MISIKNVKKSLYLLLPVLCAEAIMQTAKNPFGKGKCGGVNPGKT